MMKAILMSLLPWGTTVIMTLQSLSHPALDIFFTGVTFLGMEGFYLLLLSVLVWCMDKDLGLRVALLVLSSTYLNEALKALFHCPQPDPEVVRWIASTEGWGFPSGHAQTATALFGYLALRFRPRRWAPALWLAPPLVSLSRVYLGVHYPHDVAGGILIGLAFLALFNWAIEGPPARWWERLRGVSPVHRLCLRPMRRRFLSACTRSGTGAQTEDGEGYEEQAGALALITIALAASNLPPYAIAAMGALLGIGLGALWERRGVRFVPRTSAGKQTLKLTTGLALLLLIYGLSKILLPAGKAFRFLRYAILGGVATGALPWLFLRWGWGGSESGERTDT
ncbi:MAG: phosphatase PAP2 family protein [Chloroflexota bacterium]|nr:phosphatase PAP2 family protein [Chloroflexota bacterium]